jgi:hypothetical protein
MWSMFTDVLEERLASIFIKPEDGNVGERLNNHIPEDYLNDKGRKQPQRRPVVFTPPPQTGVGRGYSAIVVGRVMQNWALNA